MPAGRSAAFPDPCWSESGPVVIPYANTAYAKHTANGSNTVFIGGKPVMLKDKSYFTTSTGNEADAGPKGLMTGVKQGKLLSLLALSNAFPRQPGKLAFAQRMERLPLRAFRRRLPK